MEVVGVLIGAILALVAQWFITPVIERRMRARERWEQDVLALGALLTVELPASRHRLYEAWIRWYLRKSLVTEYPALAEGDEKASAGLRRLWDQAKQPSDEWEQLIFVRFNWLSSRVRAALEPSSAFERAAVSYWMHSSMLIRTFWESTPDGPAADLEDAGRRNTHSGKRS